jgi:glycosyltransferase involved in cell wall biosynthesis
MNIAIVAPLCERVPPCKYGGTERVVYFLVEELVRLGHKVTLYAAGGSNTSARLVACSKASLRELGSGCSPEDTRGANTAQLNLVMSASHDIIHVHHHACDYHPAIVSKRTTPIIWTDHNSLHTDNKPAIFRSLANLGIGMTALSDSQRRTVPSANWLATIHHGLPKTLLTPEETVPTYLAFLGRIAPEKGITAAVRIANAAGFKLKVAAKIDKLDQDFYDRKVKDLFTASQIDFIGEISDTQKGGFLSAAIALIFPICWLEPFGLVMIEAMACGCPVIAFGVGSVPEIIENGVTGFVVDSEEAAVEVLQHIGVLDRKCIRQRFEERFTSTVMVTKYLDVYQQTIAQAAATNMETADAVAANFREISGSFQTSHPAQPLLGIRHVNALQQPLAITAVTPLG